MKSKTKARLMISTDCTCVVATVMSKCDRLLYKAAVCAGLSMEQSLPVAMINRTSQMSYGIHMFIA